MTSTSCSESKRQMSFTLTSCISALKVSMAREIWTTAEILDSRPSQPNAKSRIYSNLRTVWPSRSTSLKQLRIWTQARMSSGQESRQANYLWLATSKALSHATSYSTLSRPRAPSISGALAPPSSSSKVALRTQPTRPLSCCEKG